MAMAGVVAQATGMCSPVNGRPASMIGSSARRAKPQTGPLSLELVQICPPQAVAEIGRDPIEVGLEISTIPLISLPNRSAEQQLSRRSSNSTSKSSKPPPHSGASQRSCHGRSSGSTAAMAGLGERAATVGRGRLRQDRQQLVNRFCASMNTSRYPDHYERLRGWRRAAVATASAVRYEEDRDDVDDAEEEDEEEEKEDEEENRTYVSPVTRQRLPDWAPARDAVSTDGHAVEVKHSSFGGLTEGAGGSGRVAVVEYVKGVREHLKNGGPPRWFSPVDAKPPSSDAPLMLFLPGADGSGLSLFRQHKSLSRLFELRCLCSPAMDRTPFFELVKIVEEVLYEEKRRNPARPLYLLGEAFGATLALVVAARNSDLFLHLVLVNPATSFERTAFAPLLPFMEALPKEFFNGLPFILNTTIGNPFRNLLSNLPGIGSPLDQALQVRNQLTEMVMALPTAGSILPKEAVLWKLKLLKEGSEYANQNLGKVRVPVLVFVSTDDRILPSGDEGKRLLKELSDVSVRTFTGSGHMLLLGDGIDLGRTIRSTGMYRPSRSRCDVVSRFVPPTDEEKEEAKMVARVQRLIYSPVFLSTSLDGEVQLGLGALPDSRPMLLIGNHQTLGTDMLMLVDGIFREKHCIPRGLAHPVFFAEANLYQIADFFRLYGTVPISPKNLYTAMANQDIAFMFPGGTREAFKRKDETYSVIWPEKQEFVRTAIRHGATIVPFAAIGLDDSVHHILESEDIMKLPIIGDRVRKLTQRFPQLRATPLKKRGDVFLPPLTVPKGISRLYFLFQKPIPTKGMYEAGALSDAAKTDELYMNVKRQVEEGIEYLLKKRESDPYRDFLPRVIYETSRNGKQAPTFEV